ncbi:SDR family oxidoreductase [Arenimonas oryziterrae]|uniref:Short-chain dehydrogenase n=1 Tax=Arenimonas oryziterrae DSM 21050 = YC6267 TaxID=1121015 RepID=A0A091AXJ9_9GAMM|nr:SDR family oxidoreductase [Arenimonas oryziterrae]KFN44186.1 hypothetical protein N789_07150 [Arenimonas oryziterrae DSM 21050 = YC6267]
MNSPAPRRVLVTGAGRGLGLAFVRALLARGDQVLATCREPTANTALRDLLPAHPDRLHLLALDVNDSARFSAFAADVGAHVEALDLLINNAGVLPTGERFGQLRAETLEATLRTNTVAPLLLAQALAPALARGRRPCVANLSTELGSIASTRQFHSPSYAISKAALNMAGVLLGAALAADGVRVVNLHPGWVRTQMGGPNAALDPEHAVHDLLQTLDRLPADCHGAFLDRHGQPLPW